MSGGAVENREGTGAGYTVASAFMQRVYFDAIQRQAMRRQLIGRIFACQNAVAVLHRASDSMNTKQNDAEMPKAPMVSAFPTSPVAWYLFCHTSELQCGPVAKRILGRELVAFRTASGKLAVLDARCSHLGANIGCGEVVGETIQCPFHHWRFDRDGRCAEIPALREIPAFARQQSYPVIARHGFVFFFNAVEALYPLPFFEAESPEDFAAGKLFSYEADANWFMVAAQGFDRQHFESVHDRRLLSPPSVSCPNPFLRRNQYHAEIVGKSGRDRILRRLVGNTVTLTVHNWGGTLYVVKAEFPRACSRFIVSFRPLPEGRTHFDVVVFARRGWPQLGLPLRRWFTRGHLVSEAQQVRQTEYRPARFTAADADMIECFRWLAALPQESSATQVDIFPVDREPGKLKQRETVH
jgi:phenylpropionate dioxygenase-like ring-hydroxylating dioxygenase large terminal subunit